jgi:hypothetical protein
MTSPPSTVNTSGAAPDLLESPGWQRRRWWALITGVFLTQLAMIYWLGDHAIPKPRPIHAPPTLRFTGPAWVEWLALQDPTLFALPHRESFSGLAWQISSPPDLKAADWPEPPRWLGPVVPQLGTLFNGLVEAGPAEAYSAPTLPLTGVLVAEPDPRQFFPDHSTWRMEGELSARRLLTPFQLPSWSNTNTDILTNSIVQMVVDAEGWPVSLTLLCPSGSREADQHALEAARTARFESSASGDLSPANLSPASWSWGQLTFYWHTTVPPATNSPAVPRH